MVLTLRQLIRHAVTLLGFNTVRNLALAFSMRRMLGQQKQLPSRIYASYSQHALACGVMAQFLAHFVRSGDIDAAFGGYDLLTLQDQGVAKIVYSTKNDSPAYLRHAHLIVTEEFANKYPDITKRVVKVVVQAAHWIAQNEANPAPIYQLCRNSGIEPATRMRS